jgi:Asp-tRNA(Asn)/Glu-tRNA(Gln) amidotransferase A subunit family amidase
MRAGFRSVHGPIVALGVIGGVAALVPGGVIAQSQPSRAAGPASAQFRLEEATIADIHRAMTARQIATVSLVERYLERIKAYNGVCVEQPEGILGTIRRIPNAGQINALQTLNLRPATRKARGFDDRKARSMTDASDGDAAMPDALETAADLDRRFAQTGTLVGPLHGIVFAIKDQFDTVDMRTTNGADAFYANDRPPNDATLVKKLREAGAIILAKSNMGEYASGDRSAFGGVFCNPYATDRSPGGSSGGSGTAVAANLVTCAIGEETAPSIRMPSRFNNIVGLSPSQGLVSRDGMFGGGISDRAGPMCRTVEDVARVLDVIAGYDPADEFTAYSIGRRPATPYERFTHEKNLRGVRIGVLREYMDKSLFTDADVESIDLVERAVGDLRTLGATVIDPGPSGALFQPCIDRYVAQTRNALFINQFPSLFPWDAAGKPAVDHIPLLVELSQNPSRFEETFSEPSRRPQRPTIRDFGPGNTVGERKWLFNRYLHERGDRNIRSVTDLIEKANFFTDFRPGTRFADKKAELVGANAEMTLDLRDRMQHWLAVQQIVLQCMAMQQLDALVYPTGNIPPPILGALTEPVKNGRGHMAWTLLGQQGFPAITVPAGFTTHVFDRVRDAAAPGGTRLVGPVPARLPVGVDFLGRPFDEATLLRIASAYEAATRHRVPPPSFGLVPRS